MYDDDLLLWHEHVEHIGWGSARFWPQDTIQYRFLTNLLVHFLSSVALLSDGACTMPSRIVSVVAA